MEELCFPCDVVSTNDRERWHQEGFIQCRSNWIVLEQHHGGPCAVLAAVQAYMLLYSFYEANGSWQTISEADGEEALVHALVSILDQTRMDKSDPILICPGLKEELITIDSVEEAVVFVEASLDLFQSSGGVLCFLYSLVSTRGVENIRDDMDDASTGLTGQFGHCTQELLNLLLVGKATSQVHDGDVDLGGGMTLRGVHERPSIGFLTHMEALRYCQVGSLYKKPKYPIWLIGSESHFTVLHCNQRSINDESRVQQTQNMVKRAFSEHDQGENGFIAIEKLPMVLSTIGLSLNDIECAQMIATCEMPGSGIILWDALWNCVRPLVVVPTEWSCSQCTFINEPTAQECAVCHSVHRAEEVAEQEAEDDKCYSVTLTHVNGLVKKVQGVEKGPVVCSFQITKVSQDLQAPQASGGEPIEEVVQTRWSGCLFTWPESGPPSING